MAGWEQAPWLVSIALGEGRAPAGAGVLVTDRHVLTCAHVVREAAGPEPPDGPLFVRFQWAGEHDPLPAVVVADGWHPPESEEQRGDLAVLELRDPLPEGARRAPLVSTTDTTAGHEFHVYGFPEGPHHRGGIPAYGSLRGASGHERIGLESSSQIGHGLARGFSGSPVWDRTLGGVVGIVVARDKPFRGQDTRTAYAISVDALAQYWPPLRGLIRAPITEAQRERIDSLLGLPLDDTGELPRLHDINIYDIGVTPPKILQERPDPPYVPRLKEDRELEEALRERSFVVLTGDSKAGKSRTLIEVLRRALAPGTRIVVPRPIPSAPGDLASLPLPTGGDDAVLWLDDIDEYLRPGGVDTRVIVTCQKMFPHLRVVATITSERLTSLKALKGEVNRTASKVLEKARTIELARLLSEEERDEAQRLYPEEDFTNRGIGEQMVAAPLVEERFNGGHDSCPEGWAVARAAADWHRMGCEVPLTRAALADLFTRYLAAGPSNRAATKDLLQNGIEWAAEAVVGNIALLTEYGEVGAPPHATGDEDREGLRYEAFAYLPGYLDGRNDPDTVRVPPFAWELAVFHTPPDHLLGVAFAAFTREEGDAAVSALERAHSDATETGVTAWAALMLGELAMYVDQDLDRAKELLGEAAGSGAADVAPLAQLDLAAALQLAGDLAGARRLLEAAVDSGDPQAAPLARAGLGGLLLSQGETTRARELLEAALESGDAQVVPLVQTGFGGLIMQRQEMSKAGSLTKRDTSGPLPSGGQPSLGGTEALSLPRAVRESAISSAVPLAQVNLSAALVDQGELDRAYELLHTALSSENPWVVPLAQANLGGLYIQRGEPAKAREMLDAAAESGHLLAAEHAQVTLAWLLCQEERLDEAQEILTRAVHFTNPDQSLRAHCLLSMVHAARGEYTTAAEQLQAVVDSQHAGWSALARADQGMNWAQAGDYDRARRALAEIADSGHPDQGPRAADFLGDVRATLEDWPGAEAAYRAAIDSGHPVWAHIARLDLALMLTRLGDERGPGLLAEVADSDEPDMAPRAADLLGDALAARGDWAGAEAAYQQAMDSGHAHWSSVARVDLALMLAEREELDRAEALFTEEVESRSAMAELAEAFLGILLVLRGRVEEGRPILSRIAGSDWVEAADLASVQLAKMAAQEGRPEEAALRFEALLASGSEIAASVAPLARAHLGALRLQQGEIDDALELLDEATASGHTDATAVAFAGRGEYLVEVGDTAAAQQYLRAALDLEDPEVSPKALALLGVAMLAENELDEARAALSEALATETPAIEPMTRRYLGSTLARLGRRAEARETLLPLAGSDDPDHRPQALVILGQLAMLEGQVDEARGWFGQAVASDAPDARAQALDALDDTTTGHRPSRRPDVTPVPESPVRPTPLPGPSPSRTALLAGLGPGMLLLLGRVAEAEGLPEEALYWLDRAYAAGSDPEEARSLAETLSAPRKGRGELRDQP
ncbi:tetratricopeptide repeat protein [Streptomyces spongiae]|uniref:Tetratricopeptide repeat protein n=1 Tax=Streptomyces spongiae TaxID=565072 RepID=A0A5N8XAD1_9ACTN|nr:serine protease [Streptomyces spongiae]MPY56347.1 tetratricopeptide repeat protein [Streptomyces spongiae]